MIPTSDTFEILFVDDSVAHVRIAREALAAGGAVPHRLTVADTGADALDRLFRRPPYEAAARPDLILLDLDLPAVTGLDVLRAVKAEPSLRRVPVVVVTRSPRPESAITRARWISVAPRSSAAGIVVTSIDCLALVGHPMPQ